MSITDTEPTQDAEPSVIPKGGGGSSGPTLAIKTDDHKSLGRMFILFSALLGIGAWVLQGLSTADQIESLKLLSSKVSGQIYTLGHISVILMFVIPLLIGLAIYIVPLQVGSSSIAFPRAAAASFWIWLVSSIVVIAANLAMRGGVSGTKAKAVDLSYLALGVAVMALLLATVCVIATVFTMRASDMTLDRVPLFSWGMVVGGSMWLVTLPVLLGNIALIYLDHHFGKQADFGAADEQWKQIMWAFSQPQVFVYAAPALGIIGDIVATMSGTRERARGFVMAAMGGFAILGFGAWAQSFHDEVVWQRGLFVVVSLVLVLPTLAAVSGWLTTAGAGKPKVATPAMFALLSTLTFLVAVLAGGLFVVEDLKLQSTPFFADGVLVLAAGAAMLAALGGLHYWAPKIWGRSLNTGLGRLSALIGFIGVMLGGLALCVEGFSTRFTGLADATKALNGAAAGGMALAAVAVALTLLSLVMSPRKGQLEDDPWGGQTLEWATSSPPPADNFVDLPEVTSAEPVLDMAGSSKEQ